VSSSHYAELAGRVADNGQRRCYRCGGQLPDHAGFFHLQLEKCLDGLRIRVDELERILQAAGILPKERRP
jgi:hypothetical protein